MLNKDAKTDSTRVNEEEYFHRKERELLEKMSYRQRLESDGKQMTAIMGISDKEILDDLQALGYNRETVNLLYLVPLIQIAWTDGGVVKRERERILAVAKIHGIEEGSPAFRQLTDWLDNRPSQDFFEKTLLIIHHILEAKSPENRNASRDDLVSYCTDIAAASGGILGFGSKISESERLLLEQIASELDFHGKQ